MTDKENTIDRPGAHFANQYRASLKYANAATSRMASQRASSSTSTNGSQLKTQQIVSAKA